MNNAGAHLNLAVTQVDSMLLIAGLLLMLSVMASKVSTRFGVPALVLFICIGMLAGSEGLGGIHFEDYRLAHGLGVMALVLILFGGGLNTHWPDIKPVMLPGLSLATFGVAITAGIVGCFAYFVAEVSPLEGLLLGAIVSSTDAAAVFSVLGAQKLKLKGKLTALLEFESGTNDPMAAFLTIGLTGLLLGQLSSPWMLLPQLAQEFLIGLVFGVAVGRIVGKALSRLHLEYEGLYQVLTIATAFVAFGGAQVLAGNGFLAVYVAGVVLGGRRFVHRAALIQFHESLGWLMQIAMFLTLGLLVFPSALLVNPWNNLLLAVGLVFVARPVAVFLCLLPFNQISLRKRVFVSWVGLRGAVPIVLATIPLLEGVKGALEIFNVVFFIVLVSVTVQGTTIGWVARVLGVVVPHRIRQSERELLSSLLELQITDNSPAVGRSVVDLSLPSGTLITLLSRGATEILPRGATVLEAGDRLLVRAPDKSVAAVRAVFAGGEGAA